MTLSIKKTCDRRGVWYILRFILRFIRSNDIQTYLFFPLVGQQSFQVSHRNIYKETEKHVWDEDVLAMLSDVAECGFTMT